MLRPGQKLPPTSGRQDATERKLVGRCRIGEPRLGQLVRAQALAVDGDGDHLGTGGHEDLMREVVAWIFGHDPVPGIEQQPRAEVEALLRAGADHRSQRLAAQPARPPETAPQGDAKAQ